MTTNQQINHDCISIYNAIKKIMTNENIIYCQSWWIRLELKNELTTAKINRRCDKLIKEGYLTINRRRTSTSTGICYELTNKKL